MRLGDPISKAINWGLSKTGVAAFRRKSSRRKVVILAYGQVLSSPAEVAENLPERAISQYAFREHMQWMTKHFEIIGLRRFCNLFLTDNHFKRPTAIITFENGYRSTYAEGAPILNDLALEGTFFLTTGLIGGEKKLSDDRALAAARGIFNRQSDLIARFPDEGMPSDCKFIINLLVARPQKQRFLSRFFEQVMAIPQDRRLDAIKWFEQLGRVEEQGEPGMMMNWIEARELFDAGWDIGSAGASDVPLVGRETGVVESELIDSVRIIQEKTGRAPAGLAYPKGRTDEWVLRIAKRTGFLCGVTLHPGRADGAEGLFALPRVFVNQANAPDALSLERLLSFQR